MHRAYSIILVILLVVALAVPAFASTGDLEYNGVALPALPAEDNNPYKYITYKDGSYSLHTSPVESFYRPNGDISVRQSGGITGYTLSNGSWHRSGVTNRGSSSTSPPYYKAGIVELVWSNYDFMQDNADGSTTVFMAGTDPVVPSFTCDGTSCPATDVNHDNICDDCGGVLTMSLRSSLLDFAKAQAESWGDTWAYYAVVAIGSNTEEYSVYMSNQPQVANVDGSNVVTSPNGLIRFQVTTKKDGTFEASGNYGAEQWVGNLIYSNHTIENFRTPPLAVIIQGVTGEAMETTLPNLHQTMKILLLCGVGCLALLIGLKLFGKRSLLHLRK